MRSGLSDVLAGTLVALLLLVALAAVVTLWTLNPTSTSSEPIFAIYLAIDLVCFAMVSYIYRATKKGSMHSVPLLAGALLVVLLVAAGFAA